MRIELVPNKNGVLHRVVSSFSFGQRDTYPTLTILHNLKLNFTKNSLSLTPKDNQ